MVMLPARPLRHFQRAPILPMRTNGGEFVQRKLELVQASVGQVRDNLRFEEEAE